MKKYVCFEIPCNTDGSLRPQVSLAVGEIAQFVTRKLQEIGLEPVKTVFIAIEDNEQLSGRLV